MTHFDVITRLNDYFDVSFDSLWLILTSLYEKVNLWKLRMSDVDIVDFKRDVYLNDSTRRPRALVSFGGETEIERIAENIVAYSLFDSDEIESIEGQLEAMIQRAAKVGLLLK